MTDDIIHRDCLTPTLLALGVAGALISGLVLFIAPEPEHRRPIAQAGDWITRPDGRRVCRITRTIVRYEVLPATGWCTDWQERTPVYGETVGNWTRSTQGYFQIMVNGEWRP